MPATIPMELVPFQVPEHVTVKLPPGRRQDGFRESPIIQLKDLPPETLEVLIAEWVANVRERGSNREVTKF